MYKSENRLETMNIEDLRRQWAQEWGIEPHAKISRAMLMRSLDYKLRERQMGGLSKENRTRLKQLIANYKRNPRCFDENICGIKPGTRIVKTWNGKRHSVLVVPSGFEYQDRIFTSLSEVAFAIAGTRWNGWRFFGLKKASDEKKG